jgi:predicted ATPase
MIVQSFNVIKLFGIIDSELSLKPDLSVIVGRNASGKTSVLSLLAHFMHLDMDSIRATRFESATAVFAHGSENITIHAENDGDGSFLSIRWGERQAKISLSDDLSPRINKRFASPSLATFYGVSTPQEVSEALQAWNEISREFRRTSRVTFVRLDRTVIAVNPQGEEAREEFEPAFRMASSASKSPPKDPIDLVIEATRERFFRYKQELSLIRYSAYKSLMQLHFTPIKSTKKKGDIAGLEKKLTNLRARVSKSQFAKELGTQDEYFNSLVTLLNQAKAPSQRKLGRKTLAEESLQFMLEISEHQIEGLLKIFDEEQTRTTKAEREIKAYIDTLEKFLKESGKRLWFSEERFELAFYVPAIGEKQEGEGRSLKTLSSGERQVVIVLTYLAFLSGPDSVFIIDEPELSLHLRWQGYLMAALKALRPQGGQIIVATHAPEIAGRAAKNCIQLRQDYMPEVAEVDDDE